MQSFKRPFLDKNWHRPFSPISWSQSRRPSPMSQGREVHAARNEAMMQDAKNWANNPVSFCPPLWSHYSYPFNVKNTPISTQGHAEVSPSCGVRRNIQDSMKNARYRCGLDLGTKLQVAGHPLPHPRNKQQCNGDR